MVEDSYRVCWYKPSTSKNYKDIQSTVHCSIKCYELKYNAINHTKTGYKHVVTKCNPQLPEFIDLIRCENNVQIHLENKSK